MTCTASMAEQEFLDFARIDVFAAADMILASVADDPKVKEAAVRWDRATPSTHYDLVRARDEAQARTGIPVANRAFLYSAEVDSILLPIVMCMGPGDETATA